MDSKALVRYILSPWVIGGAIFIGVSMLCASIVMLQATRSERGSFPAATAIVHVIPLPSATPTPLPPTPTPEAAPTQPVPAASGNIVVGAFVQVTGTGGDGVRLRAEPGLNGTVRFLGLEAEVFQVSDGPRQVDGYTWWFLVAPYDASVQGWAVANYLAVVQNP
jgi:hypothetical protein